MTESTRFPRPSRHVVTVATVLLATVALTTLGAHPALAVDDEPPTPFCPPVSQTIGTHLKERLYDPDASPGHFVPSLVSGTLPAGASLFDGRWYSDYSAVPTTAGSYDFTVQLTSELGTTSQAVCHVDVSDALDLSGLTASRLAAPDRYAESATIARMFPAGVPVVYVASGEVFADALSASAVAAERGAPLLLTTATDIPSSVASELARLRPEHIVILGGLDTLSAAVENSLRSFTVDVRRVGGANRFEASRQLIGDPTFGALPSKTMYIASGNVFPDALSAGPAAGTVKAPVMLVNGSQPALTSAEANVLSSRGVSRAIIVGGASTVSAPMETDLRVAAPQVKRIEGADRFDASAAVARDTIPNSANVKPDTVYLATGEKYPDALSGAPLATLTGSPIYLVHSDCIPRDAARHILDIGATKVVLLGGSESLTQEVMDLKVCAK